MPLVERVRPRIGDVIEIPTSSGCAYAHFTHKHVEPPRYGAMIRVLPGLYDQQPSDFGDLVRHPPQFITFFPLGAACSRKIVRVVASELVPESAKDFPTFRSSHRDREGKRVGPWSLWDGRRSWKVERLTEIELKRCPPLGVWNDTLLVERILSGWSHEKDF